MSALTTYLRAYKALTFHARQSTANNKHSYRRRQVPYYCLEARRCVEQSRSHVRVSLFVKRTLATAGHGRLLLQQGMDGPISRTIPPGSNTSLAVPILTYQLESPSMAPSPSPSSIGSEIAQLTEALAPALAPVAIIAQEVS